MEIACIVEGDGEDEALPVLVRRIIAEIGPVVFPRVSVPVSWPRSRLTKQEYLVRAVGLAAQRATPAGAILILVDADDDCPVQLGSRLLAWAQSARRDMPVAVIVANREYESWFLAAAESLRGHRGLAADLTAPTDCDSIRDAKGWLRDRTTTSERYIPTAHQTSFSDRINLDQARLRSRSFRKLDKEIRRLVAALQAAQN